MTRPAAPMRFTGGGFHLFNFDQNLNPFNRFNSAPLLFQANLEDKRGNGMIRRYEPRRPSPLRFTSFNDVPLVNPESEREVTYPGSSNGSNRRGPLIPGLEDGRYSFESNEAFLDERIGVWLSNQPDIYPHPSLSRSMPLYSEKHAFHASTSSISPSKETAFITTGLARNMTIRRTFVLMGICLALAFFYSLHLAANHSYIKRPAYLMEQYSYNSTFLPYAPFQPPEPVPYRISDIMDTFMSYKYRNTCNISSLDLHAPFAPLCQDRQSLLTAMSSGGRIGNDAPYMPRGCDMRWFSTEEICEILSKFSRVLIIGDSMMRHVTGAINVLLRKDLGYGAVTNWNFKPQELQDCFCNYQFNVKACSVQGIYKTSDVAKNDPDSLACKVEAIVKFPIPEGELNQYRQILGTTKPNKPIAFIFGHGLWNDLDLQATLDWLDTILDATTATLPYLNNPNAFFPRLFVTPNACGNKKEDQFLVTQGDKALMLFEENVAIEVNQRGVEHLGTWNMSAQSNKYDGVHLDLKGNTIKAMMVINWLSMLEVEKH